MMLFITMFTVFLFTLYFSVQTALSIAQRLLNFGAVTRQTCLEVWSCSLLSYQHVMTF